MHKSDDLKHCNNISFASTFSFPSGPIPTSKMAVGNDPSSRSFRNLVLSYRGAERQAPNVLQLALKFSRLMEIAEQEGRHLPTMSTEDRLRAIISDFHDSPGLATKNQLDEDKIRAILNILVGTCPVSWIQSLLVDD